MTFRQSVQCHLDRAGITLVFRLLLTTASLEDNNIIFFFLTAFLSHAPNFLKTDVPSMAFRIKVPQRRKAFLSNPQWIQWTGKSWAHCWQPEGAQEGGGLNLAAGDKMYFHSGFAACYVSALAPPKGRYVCTLHKVFTHLFWGSWVSLSNDNMSKCLSSKQSVNMGWGSHEFVSQITAEYSMQVLCLAFLHLSQGRIPPPF